MCCQNIGFQKVCQDLVAYLLTVYDSMHISSLKVASCLAPQLVHNQDNNLLVWATLYFPSKVSQKANISILPILFYF